MRENNLLVIEMKINHKVQRGNGGSIDAEPLPPPVAPPLTFDTSYTVGRDPGIASLVCCDGSYPHHEAAPGPSASGTAWASRSPLTRPASPSASA